jgi:predicted nucleic acid-binding protein
MIIDSNVVIELLRGSDDMSAKIAKAYAHLSARYDPVINTIIFAETAMGSPTLESFENRLSELEISVVLLDNADAFRASHAFVAYRQNRGPRTTILPDFLIGAQASNRGWPILTRDPKRFSSYFPEVELIDPLEFEI